MELADLVDLPEPKLLRDENEMTLNKTASRYPYLETLFDGSAAVLMPNPDIHCYADDLEDV